MNHIDWKRLRPVSVFLAITGVLLGMFGIWFDTQLHVAGIGKLLTFVSLAAIAATIAALWASCSSTRTMTIRFSVLAAALLILPLLAVVLALMGAGVPPT